MPSLRKGLKIAVIGNRNRLHAPVFDLFDDVLCAVYRVQIAHLCVAVELHPLFPRVIFSLALLKGLGLLHAVHRAQNQFAVAIVYGGCTAQL